MVTLILSEHFASIKMQEAPKLNSKISFLDLHIYTYISTLFPSVFDT